jgi:hypothetical protein
MGLCLALADVLPHGDRLSLPEIRLQCALRAPSPEPPWRAPHLP